MNKVISMSTNTEATKFDSLNNLVHFEVLESNGPEIVLDNNCFLLFDSITQYYSIITNAELFDIANNSFDLDMMVARAKMHLRDDCAAICEYRQCVITEVTQITGLDGFDTNIYILRRE